MKRFEIMFEDLTIDAQESFLKFLKVKSFEDSNLELAPIAIIELEKEDGE